MYFVNIYCVNSVKWPVSASPEFQNICVKGSILHFFFSMASLCKAPPQSPELIPSFLWEEVWFLLEREHCWQNTLLWGVWLCNSLCCCLGQRASKRQFRLSLGLFFVVYFGVLCFCVWKKRNLIGFYELWVLIELSKAVEVYLLISKWIIKRDHFLSTMCRMHHSSPFMS